MVSSKETFNLACYVKVIAGIRGARPMPVLQVTADNRLNVCFACGQTVVKLLSTMRVLNNLYQDPVSIVKAIITLRYILHRISLV